jgi:hypothetical protein
MEEKYKRFLNYNWAQSSEWQNYYSNLFPTPPGNKVDHFKKKFYKLKIDVDFDVTWTPSNNQANTSQNSNRSNSNNQTSSSTDRSSSAHSSNILSSMEPLLWLLFLLSVPFLFHSLKIAALALLIKVFRQVGTPKFNMEFAQILFVDYFFQQVIYCLLFLLSPNNYFILVPLVITALVILAEFVNQRRPQLPQLNFLIPYVNKILLRKNEFIAIQSSIELGVGFLLIIGGFIFNINSWILPIFYWQYIRFKYLVNDNTKKSFSRLNVQINRIKEFPQTPGLVKTILEKIQQFGAYMGSNEAQSQGSQNCVIF